MNTQDTPVHLRLWHRDFWCLSMANMLISMVVYGQIFMVQTIAESAHIHQDIVVKSWGAYGLGLFVLGVFVSYLVQRYKRRRVCLVAMIGVAAAIGGTSFVTSVPMEMRELLFLGARFAVGMLFGLAQMVLSSTLVIDISESYQRTEANYVVAWFGRLAMALGPFAAIMIHKFFGSEVLTWTMVALSVLAVVLVHAVNFPFRMPSDNIKLFSLDRFLLLKSWMLFVNLFLVSVAVGIVLALHWNDAFFFAAIMVGFLLAIWAEKIVFANAELMSEAIAGLLLLGFAILMLWSGQDISGITSAICVGLGAGLLGSRFLLFFIKLRDHCQRGTSQSSCFLSWESGMALGLFIGVGGCCNAASSCHGGDHRHGVLLIALAFVIVALAMYVGFTHKWYMKHKNR